MEKGENYNWICMESILNKDSEGCKPDPFLKITTGKLLIRRNLLAEGRPRNVIPNPTCLPTKSFSRKGRHGSHLKQEKTLFSLFSSLSLISFKLVFLSALENNERWRAVGYMMCGLKPQHLGKGSTICLLMMLLLYLSYCQRPFRKSLWWMSGVGSNEIAGLFFTFVKKVKILSMAQVLQSLSLYTWLMLLPQTLSSNHRGLLSVPLMSMLHCLLLLNSYSFLQLSEEALPQECFLHPSV